MMQFKVHSSLLVRFANSARWQN